MGVATEGLVYLRRHLKKTLLSPAAGGCGVASGSWIGGTALPLFLYTAHLTLGYFMMLVRELYLQHITYRVVCSVQHVVLHVTTYCMRVFHRALHACMRAGLLAGDYGVPDPAFRLGCLRALTWACHFQHQGDVPINRPSVSNRPCHMSCCICSFVNGMFGMRPFVFAL
jgi:hypothetical protein